MSAPIWAQQGETDPAAKSLKGFGGHCVREIVAPHAGQYLALSLYGAVSGRGVCVARLSEEIEEWHSDAKQELDLIRQRLIDAERDHRDRQN